MLTDHGLLESLEKIENKENEKYENDDFDFGEVLKFYAEGTVPNCVVRYVDEQTENSLPKQ